MTMGAPQSAGRLAVEKLLADNPADAFDPRTVAERTGLPLAKARSHLNNATSGGRIHNSTPDQLRAHYRWGPAPKPQPIGFRPRPGDYDGKDLQPFAGRPGPLRAFELPSLVGGKQLPRVAPVAIASHTRERVL